MVPKKRKAKFHRTVLRLSDLDHSKTAVLNALTSPASRRTYEYAIEQFIAWYCSEPRLALNRIVVVRYRIHLEASGLAAATINQRLAAVRRLAHEAADCGLLSADLAAGIQRVKGARQLGQRSGNWLSLEQSSQLVNCASGDGLRERRDCAMLAILVGCGLRRAELANLPVRRSRSVKAIGPSWTWSARADMFAPYRFRAAKEKLDRWTSAAAISTGRVFRAIRKNGAVWGDCINVNVVWHVVNRYCRSIGLEHVAPHDLRRTCAKLCHASGGELEQIQFLLGHVSVQTTERYLGCKQNLSHPVNDRFEIRPLIADPN